MNTNRSLPLVVFVLLAWCVSACGAPETPTPVPTNPPPTVDSNATETAIAAKIFATQTANAPTITPTPLPTNTPQPSPTTPPSPTSTPTVSPTATLVVTTPTQPAASQVTTSTLASGWIRYQVTDQNFALALPPTWARLELDPDSIQSNLQAMGDQNPQYKTLFSSQAVRNLAARGIKFYAVDTSPDAFTNGLPVTVNLIRVDMGVALPLNTVVAATLQQLKGIADQATPLKHQTVHLNNTDAEKFTYTTKITNSLGDTVPTTLQQYLAVDGRIQYVLSFVCPTALAKTKTPVFDKTGASFELLKAN